MTHEQKAKHFVDALMHKTHLAYQRRELKPIDPTLPDKTDARRASPEVKGCRREASVGERKRQQFQPYWFTGLRPNFWKAYFETLLYMTK